MDGRLIPRRLKPIKRPGAKPHKPPTVEPAMRVVGRCELRAS